MTLAILCSGQGGQHADMFGLIERDGHAESLMTRANACAGFDLAAAVAPDAARSMFGNAVAQPLICAYQGVMWAMLDSRLQAAGAPIALAAGYSVGELASHGCAGSLSWAEVIALARVRADAMSACGEGTGLLAVRGVPRSALDASLAGRRAFVAIVNGDDQCIVGGAVAVLDALVGEVTPRGGVAQRLQVSVAAHTPCLAEAVAPFREALQRCQWKASQVPVVAGIDASLVTDAPTAIDRLARQVAATIRWDACMDSLVEAGTTVCLELGPGNALARLVHERHPLLACRSVVDFRSIAGVVDWVVDALG